MKSGEKQKLTFSGDKNWAPGPDGEAGFAVIYLFSPASVSEEFWWQPKNKSANCRTSEGVYTLEAIGSNSPQKQLVGVDGGAKNPLGRANFHQKFGGNGKTWKRQFQKFSRYQ